MKITDLGEFNFIREIDKRFHAVDPFVPIGIGDDSALFKTNNNFSWLVTTDLLIDKVHFNLDYVSPEYLGRKALSVNLSDIAAMGGIPKYFLVSLGIPAKTSVSFLRRLLSGIKDRSKKYGVLLLGGDTAGSAALVINIVVIGLTDERRVIRRSGAKVGHKVFVTGTLGDAAAGLAILKKKYRPMIKKGVSYLIRRHLSPTPRIKEGILIAENRLASAMIDISDGLLQDLNHICQESGVGAKIFVDRLPLSRSYIELIGSNRASFQAALSGGEDYELLFTVPPHAEKKLKDNFKNRMVRLTNIGEIVDSNRVSTVFSDGSEYHVKDKGFKHF